MCFFILQRARRSGINILRMLPKLFPYIITLNVMYNMWLILTEELTGIIITKADKSYNLVRRDENLYFSYYPMVIVYHSNVIDVVNAVNWGRKQGLNIRCRSGGHN